jgi:hypothetical protein
VAVQAKACGDCRPCAGRGQACPAPGNRPGPAVAISVVVRWVDGSSPAGSPAKGE